MNSQRRFPAAAAALAMASCLGACTALPPRARPTRRKLPRLSRRGAWTASLKDLPPAAAGWNRESLVPGGAAA
jgi:hypothetical protein